PLLHFSANIGTASLLAVPPFSLSHKFGDGQPSRRTLFYTFPQIRGRPASSLSPLLHFPTNTGTANLRAVPFLTLFRKYRDGQRRYARAHAPNLERVARFAHQLTIILVFLLPPHLK